MLNNLLRSITYSAVAISLMGISCKQRTYNNSTQIKEASTGQAKFPSCGPKEGKFTDKDKANLKIYVGQGYSVNGSLRERVSLDAINDVINLQTPATAALTEKCNHFIKYKAEVFYYNNIAVNSYTKMDTTDYKLYYLIQDALLNRGTPYAGTVYRGTAGSCSFLMDSADKPMKYHLERGFMSTSKLESKGQVFTRPENMRDNIDAPKSGCLMKINSKSGKYIAPDTGNYNGEEEVLFAAGALFEINKVSMDGAQRVVELTELEKTRTDYSTIISLLDKQYLSGIKNDNPSEQWTQEVIQNAQHSCQEAEKFFSPGKAKFRGQNAIYNLEDCTVDASIYEGEGG